jgi:hypothetical protein
VIYTDDCRGPYKYFNARLTVFTTHRLPSSTLGSKPTETVFTDTDYSDASEVVLWILSFAEEQY